MVASVALQNFVSEGFPEGYGQIPLLRSDNTIYREHRHDTTQHATLTHRPLGKMAHILQTIFLNIFVNEKFSILIRVSLAP